MGKLLLVWRCREKALTGGGRAIKSKENRRLKIPHVCSANLRRGVFVWTSHQRSDFSSAQCTHFKLHHSNAFPKVVRVWTVMSETFSEGRDRKGGK